MAPRKSSIYDQDYSDIESFVKSIGGADFRANQIWIGLYNNYWIAPSSFSSLPISIRRQLSDHFTFTQLSAKRQVTSLDKQTTKILFQLSDHKMIETVLMNYHKRRSLCISTQVGCAMGCAFCATGQMGFFRHLSSGEIVEQVLYFARLLATTKDALTNIVIMGMGEPFLNYDETMAAIDRLNDKRGFNFGARRFTISTVGIIPAIRKFALENRQVNLAVSLHAADDSLRSSLLPINNKYPLNNLLEACRFYVATTRRRISFEWALIKDVNDSPQQASLLAKKIRGLRCHVNLIVLNPSQRYEGFPSSNKTAKNFKAIFDENGIPCSIRLRRGVEIQAGCGQLANIAPAQEKYSHTA